MRWQTKQFRPLQLAVGLLFVAIGITGVVIAARNFTFPAQDAESLPAAMAEENARRQPWLDFSFYYLMPLGPMGLIALIVWFAWRKTKAKRIGRNAP